MAVFPAALAPSAAFLPIPVGGVVPIPARLAAFEVGSGEATLAAVVARLEDGVLRVWFSDPLDQEHVETLAPANYSIAGAPSATVEGVAFNGEQALALTVTGLQPGSSTLMIAADVVQSAAGAFAPETWLVFDVPDSSAPSVSGFVPEPGAELQADAPVTFDVSDDVEPRCVLVVVRYAGVGRTDVAHDGTRFLDAYEGTREPIPGGYRYTLRRRGGWLGTLTIQVYAADAAGNEV